MDGEDIKHMARMSSKLSSSMAKTSQNSRVASRQYRKRPVSDYRFEIFAPGGERVTEKCVLEGGRVTA
jgi:hypothetical protein